MKNKFVGEFINWLFGMEKTGEKFLGADVFRMNDSRRGLFIARLCMIFHIPFCDYCKRPGLWKAYKILVFGMVDQD